MKKCDSCGKIYTENKDMFCPHCGAVAVKKCPHGSSIDSDRYHMGESYPNSDKKPNSVYAQSPEPHKQTEKYPCNRGKDTFGDTGGYSDETPRKRLFTYFDLSGADKNKKIGAIISVVVVLVNVVTALMAFNETDYETNYYEEASVEYVEETEFYPVASSASVSLIDEYKGFKTFALEIDDMYFENGVNQAEEIQQSILEDGAFTEIHTCKFSDTEVSAESYNNAVEEYFYLSANDGSGAGRYLFTYDFDYGEIVHLCGGVSMYLDNGMYVNVELPFCSFSISEDGEVTYYTSYASYDTDWNTVFNECSNVKQITDYEVYIEF